MKRTIALLVGGTALVCATANLSGCSRHDTKSSMPPPVSTSVQFTVLAKQILVAPADTSVPVEVGALNIAYVDNENPQAFDDVLPPAT